MGYFEGKAEGFLLGNSVGDLEGWVVGVRVGPKLGFEEGSNVGFDSNKLMVKIFLDKKSCKNYESTVGV